MNYVYSTLSSDNVFPVYDKQIGGNSNVSHSIKINGGANVMKYKRTVSGSIPLETPFGVVTHVSDSDLELLLSNQAFKNQMSSGFIKIEKKELKVEKVIEDMNKEDNSSQLTEEKFEKKKKKMEGFDIKISAEKV